MASIINASTTGAGGVITTADSSGVLQLQSGGTIVATLNATGVNAGIQVAANAAPAFSASMTAVQTLGAATFTKITYGSESFDTNNNFTTSRFTPTVAGYYQVSAGLYTATATLYVLSLYQNGTTPVYEFGRITASSSGNTIVGSGLVYLNGTTDYIEIFAYLAAGGNVGGGASLGWFNGALVRSA